VVDRPIAQLSEAVAEAIALLDAREEDARLAREAKEAEWAALRAANALADARLTGGRCDQPPAHRRIRRCAVSRREASAKHSGRVGSSTAEVPVMFSPETYPHTHSDRLALCCMLLLGCAAAVARFWC